MHSSLTMSNSAGSAISVTARGGMSPRGRVVAWLLATLILLAGCVALAAAGSLPITGARAQSSPATVAAQTEPMRLGGTATPSDVTGLDASIIEAAWDGPAVHLDWRGAEYARAEATFVGERVASPGDRVVRTLNVVNAGPRDGIASVTIDAEQLIPEGALNPDLADDVTLFWDVAGIEGEEQFAALLHRGRVSVAELAVPQGETVAVSVGFAMDRAVETSASLGADSTALTFGVGVELTGETEAPVIPPLPETGAAGILAVIGLAAALLLSGWALLGLRRRRRCDACDRRVTRDVAWVRRCDAAGVEETLCGDCEVAGTQVPAGR